MTLKIDKQLRWFILGVLGASVIAVVVTVIVVSTARRPIASTPSPKAGFENSLSSLDVSDFQVPPSYTEAWRPRWYPSRSIQKKWTWSEVQRFWRDPRKSALTSISEENDKKMSELFKGVQ